MEVIPVSEYVSLVKNNEKPVITHSLGSEFIFDVVLKKETAYNLDDLGATEEFLEVQPIFKVQGFCSRAGEGLERLKLAINQFELFKKYVLDCQDYLIEIYQ